MSNKGIVPVERQAYYRQLCDQLGMAVIATDREATIRVWNGAAARMFGAGAERMIGTPLGSVVPQGQRAAAEQMLLRAMETGETFQLEFRHRDAAGRSRELAGTVAPVFVEPEGCVGTSVCFRDITQRIKLQEDLSESRKMASLGELAGAIAHHFNNILGGVITSVDYARAGNDPSVMTRVIEQIGSALQRATTLLNGLLVFAKGDKSADAPADFAEIIGDLIDKAGKMTAGRGIALRFNAPNLQRFPLPRAQVQTALHNILRNAVEAMPDGGTLTVEASTDNDRAVARIIDTGVGLGEAALSHVFEPFWSTKDTLVSSTTTTEGTGLGLAVAHGLVQMLGGTITVSSEPGKGSCFTVSIPRNENA
ncbi:MAG: PAS domain-containing protein [Planctomycetes bacterium]|nr:PAS domain-containing protein [Planctomycetota bacterium]